MSEVADLNFFPKDKTIGIFRGFREGGMEFRADIVLPYQNDFQNIPMHGQFLMVQLETPDEAVLGRVTSLSSEGKLSFGAGEEFNIRAVKEEREIPDDLRYQYLRYRVNIRVLGVLRKSAGRVLFAPSHRRLPHVGSPVAFPTDDLLKEIAGHSLTGVTIGCFALGEFVFSGSSPHMEIEDWVLQRSPEIKINFSIQSLISRRSFIFARAGYGKSNLNKLLFSSLYKKKPTTPKRNGNVPVGTVIFDPDGEYFWPDDKGRPGLCDVPELKDKLVVFTNRHGPSAFYHSFVAGGIKLDIRRLKASDVITIALSPEKQDQQNVRKLKGLSEASWGELVDLIDRSGNLTQISKISKILNLEDGAQQAEAIAARSNMTVIVKMLHNRSSRLMDKLIYALSEGKLCIVDVSQMRGAQSLVLSGLILRRIFDRNQMEFIKPHPKTIPTIAVVEEAQSVLNDKASATTPYIEWVKEGRKYDLGAVLVTQQPGSIPMEILSQGDNWFLFHVISAADLGSAKTANSHFSQDILSSLLNEPIKGQGVFWSSEGGKPYPVPLRVLSFNKMYDLADPNYSQGEVETYAKKLKANLSVSDHPTEEFLRSNTEDTNLGSDEEQNIEPPIDFMKKMKVKVLKGIKADAQTIRKIESKDGVAWKGVMEAIKNYLPPGIDDPDQTAYNLVPKILTEIYGKQGLGWHTYNRPNDKGQKPLYVRKGNTP